MLQFSRFRRQIQFALALSLIIVLLQRAHMQSAVSSLLKNSSRNATTTIRLPIGNLGVPQIRNDSSGYYITPDQIFFSHDERTLALKASEYSKIWQPALDSHLESIFQCRTQPLRVLKHIRLPNILRNISFVPEGSGADKRIFWNPTIIALPYWSEEQYLLIGRVVTDGNYQENVICRANACRPQNTGSLESTERVCTEDDIHTLGYAGGIRCVGRPSLLNVPPTPAEQCLGKFGPYADIAGFHDPRVFWSGKGEPLMIVNTQYVQAYSTSRYACFGLWVIDLRSLHEPLDNLLTMGPNQKADTAPLKSYPTLTELTRNPRSARATIEKNWFMFFPPSGEAFLHYDLSAEASGHNGRTFAKLLGNGFVTGNLTNPLEEACVASSDKADGEPRGRWHQASNSLRLILCNRSDPECKPSPSNTVFFALIHRKFLNGLKLPLRYERHFVVWSASPPYGMLATSRYPILLANETAQGFSTADNWETPVTNMENDSQVEPRLQRRDSVGVTDSVPSEGEPLDQDNQDPGDVREDNYWAYFTYTTSIAYAWGRKARDTKTDLGDGPQDMHEGYLDDEVILSVGVDDAGSVYASVTARDILQCMRACPGRV